MRNTSLSRSRFAAGTLATFASIAVVRAPARAAQFQYVYGNDQSISSPTTVRAIQLWKAVERESGGRLSVKTFQDSQLGGDSQMLTQLRSGAMQFLTMVGAIMGNIVPASGIDSLGFAFKDTKTAFAAMDGDLGEYIRKEIAAKGMYAIPHPFDNGFRQITANKPIRTVADLEGLKIRVPTAPVFVELFRGLGASPVPINVSELYTALQTHVVDAEENALVNITQSKLYEVQKTLNFSNHAWSCWWFLVNQEAWNALPPDIQAIVTGNVAKYAVFQRRDFELQTAALADKLHRFGMQIYQCDSAALKAKLGPYYAKARDLFGSTAIGMLEKYSGKLG